MKIIRIFILVGWVLALQGCSSFQQTPQNDNEARCQALNYQRVQDEQHFGVNNNDPSSSTESQSAQAESAAREYDQLGCH